MFQFHRHYFLLNVFLFFILCLIAMFVHDHIVRPFIGDVLVVVWMYLFLKSFITMPWPRVAIGVVSFACSIEILQYFRFVQRIGLEGNRLAEIVIGATFDPLDLVAYWIGFVLIGLGEYYQHR